MKILECIPNFSEGTDRKVVTGIVDALRTVPDVRILDFSMDEDHHRSVITFIGPPDAVERGAAVACDKAVELIDMRVHAGVHPRNGAVDVVPFVPIRGMTMDEAVSIAHRFGRAFATRNDVPVYFYGEAALSPARATLPFIRKGGYEALKEKIGDPEWLPDAGPIVFNPKSGATTVGARHPLIAFNINLKTDNLAIARDIARTIRQSSGGLAHVQALGLPLSSRNIVQVSMNLSNYRETSIRKVFDTVSQLAVTHGVEVLESELIGCLPQDAMDGITPDYCKLCDFCEDRIIETHCR
jgi:glutamate formiminotransferase